MSSAPRGRSEEQTCGASRDPAEAQQPRSTGGARRAREKGKEEKRRLRHEMNRHEREVRTSERPQSLFKCTCSHNHHDETVGEQVEQLKLR